MSEAKVGDSSQSIEKKHVSVEVTANTLNIAEENRDHPVVRDFVGFVNDIQNLQIDFGVAAQHGRKKPREAPIIENERPVPHEVDVLPSLKDRYDSADLLLRVATEVLRDGFADNSFIQNDPNRQRYLMSKLNSALGRYGLEVVERVEPKPAGDSPVDPKSRFRIVK